MKLMVPTVHLNGTAKVDLMQQLADAIDPIREAIRKLAAACPNARDYYPQGPEAIGEALRQHNARMAMLRSMAAELETIMVEADQGALPKGAKDATGGTDECPSG